MPKMFLVPTDQFERMQQRTTMNPYTEKMMELEGELQNILNDVTKSPHEKFLLYGQTLQKYLNYKAQEEESKRIKLDFPPLADALFNPSPLSSRTMAPNTTSLSTEAAVASIPGFTPHSTPHPLSAIHQAIYSSTDGEGRLEKRLTKEQIINAAAQKDQSAMKGILKNLPPSVGWDDQNQLTINNEAIEGSNILSLMLGQPPKASKTKKRKAQEDAGFLYWQGVMGHPWESLNQEHVFSL